MMKVMIDTTIMTSTITTESWTILFVIIMGSLYLRLLSRNHTGLARGSLGANSIDPVARPTPISVRRK
jgi:hypothetical protein